MNPPLPGLSGLFRIREESGSASIDTDELYGIGNMLKGLADKLSVQEDILRCGFDSMAVTKAAIDLAVAKYATKKLQKEEDDFAEDVQDED